jgi:hypothetical protein
MLDQVLFLSSVRPQSDVGIQPLHSVRFVCQPGSLNLVGYFPCQSFTFCHYLIFLTVEWKDKFGYNVRFFETLQTDKKKSRPHTIR